MKTEISPQSLEKYSNNKFNAKPSCGIQIVPFGRAE